MDHNSKTKCHPRRHQPKRRSERRTITTLVRSQKQRRSYESPPRRGRLSLRQKETQEVAAFLGRQKLGDATFVSSGIEDPQFTRSQWYGYSTYQAVERVRDTN